MFRLIHLLHISYIVIAYFFVDFFPSLNLPFLWTMFLGLPGFWDVHPYFIVINKEVLLCRAMSIIYYYSFTMGNTLWFEAGWLKFYDDKVRRVTKGWKSRTMFPNQFEPAKSIHQIWSKHIFINLSIHFHLRFHIDFRSLLDHTTMDRQWFIKNVVFLSIM